MILSMILRKAQANWPSTWPWAQLDMPVGSIADGLAYGSDGLEGKGCMRMRPEVAPARSWARFPNHWFRGIVRNLEGCAQCATPIYSSVARFKPVDTSEAAQAAL